MIPKIHKLKTNWSMDAQDIVSDSFLEKIPVDAGNLAEIVGTKTFWYPTIEKQVERLAQEWSNPESDGTGYLTYNALSESMITQIQKEIDGQILNSIHEMSKRYINQLKE